jgi:signal transduction histidine kinase
VGFTDLIANRDYPKEQTLEFTKIIQQGSEQLTSVITDIINIATIEAGQLKKFEKRTDINTLISNLFQQFTLKVAEKEINLIYSQLNGVNPIIMADETKITQILSNLIGNAIKFTDKGTIDYGCQLIDGFLQFYVKDEGIGIPTDLHEKIFERFLQIKITVNREYGGNGLGLSIAKAYVELLGGKIWIKSEPGKGSIFYFTIPYTPLLF